MKTNLWVPFLAAVVAMAALSGNAEARGVRSYSGGRGYHFRPPSVDARLSRWHESNFLTSERRRGRGGIAPLAYFHGSADFFQFEFSGKIVIVRRQNAVESVQRRLRGLGYYRGPINGTMNRGFEQALRKYQAECGARNTGAIDAETIDSLGLNAASFAR